MIAAGVPNPSLAAINEQRTLGCPLLREEIKKIWQEQKHHVECPQDPPGVQLYDDMLGIKWTFPKLSHVLPH